MVPYGQLGPWLVTFGTFGTLSWWSAISMDLSGYVLEPLREAPASTLYRGRRVNSIPILVLVPAVGEFGAECARRLEQEFALADLLDPAWATKPIALAQHDGRRVLVLDDCGGRPLGELLGKSLDIKQFLSIAVNLATALDHAHGCGLIHKDIKPANVLVDEAANVWLTGFAFATRLPRERQAPIPPGTIAGTLAYMAPEQTGRMNRSIDTRSDLYSLGVTLYELLTGKVPFVARDPMELIHCHIARKPAPPSEHAADVPAPIDTIVLKLLSKTPEDRYQTAAGVTHDLQRCLSEWTVRARIQEFPLGAQDHSGRLTVPETLYGREREIEALLAAFQRVTTLGTTEFVVVAGPSGVGKSSIVNELHKELILTRGFFGAGKLDSQRPDVPYATLTQALRQVVQQLLNRSDAELGQWRRALLDALGLNAKLIVDLIPQLSLILGEQPFAPEVPPQDRQVQFQQAFRRFIGVFAQPKHPLVLFLDDLQWIDPATLDLLEHLANDRSFRNVLFIGAYRQTELHSEHRLIRTLKRLTDAGLLQEVQLGPLTNCDVRNLVADTLQPTDASSLGDLVFEKTEGNPFFAVEFLMALEDKGHLFFDVRTRSWRWDIERIRADPITDHVAELMAAKLGRYEGDTLQLIMQLACLGSNARTTTLASVVHLAAEQVDFALREPIHAGLIRQLEGGYAFAHDRVQEAAYALITSADRAQAHLRIGRVLARSVPEDELEDNIFEIVNQFNRGAGLISDRAEQIQLAKFNLVAGNRARASTAYESALIYLSVCKSLLYDGGARESQLSFNMNLYRAECELWTGNLISAEARLVKLSLGAATLSDLARVVWVAVALYFKMDRNDQAVEMCLEYLRRVGINWSQHPTDDDVQLEYDELFYQLSRTPVEALTDLPRMSDPNDQRTMNVLAALQTSAFYSDRNLWILLLGRMTNLSLVNGNCEDSAFAYSLVGLILGPRFGQYRTGLRLGRLAFDLVETGGFERFKARVYANFASGYMPWTTALRDCVAANRRAIEAALGAGDRIYAVWSRTQLIANLFACGVPLVEVRREAEDTLRYARAASFGYLADMVAAQLKLVLALQGATEAPSSLAAGLEEQSTERYLQTDPPGSVRALRYWTRKLQGSFLANDCSSALSAAANARASLSTTPLYFERAEYHLYEALALASRLTTLPEPARAREFVELVGHQDLLAAWAEACPENFTDRSTLVAAEIARLEERELDAERLYDAAVRAARDQGFIQNEAIAYELAARFQIARGLKTIGDDFLRSARSCFARWGAYGKVRQLNQLYPHLNDEPSPATELDPEVRASKIGSGSGRRDVSDNRRGNRSRPADRKIDHGRGQACRGRTRAPAASAGWQNAHCFASGYAGRQHRGRTT